MGELWGVFCEFLNDKITAVYRKRTKKYGDNDLLVKIRPITMMKSEQHMGKTLTDVYICNDKTLPKLMYNHKLKQMKPL